MIKYDTVENAHRFLSTLSFEQFAKGNFDGETLELYGDGNGITLQLSFPELIIKPVAKNHIEKEIRKYVEIVGNLDNEIDDLIDEIAELKGPERLQKKNTLFVKMKKREENSEKMFELENILDDVTHGRKEKK